MWFSQCCTPLFSEAYYKLFFMCYEVSVHEVQLYFHANLFLNVSDEILNTNMMIEP